MRTVVLLTLLSFGCEPIEPSTELSQLTQARMDAAPSEPAAAQDAPAADVADGEIDTEADTEGGFDFDADSPEAVADADADVLEGLGLVAPVEEPMFPEDAPTEEPPLREEPNPMPGFNPDAPVVSRWTPDQAVSLSGAVQLISTTAQSQPPRAILGLADGTEVVVEPGTMLPDERIVVLAVGQDAVQIAEITPEGDRARMESRILQAMYRQGGGER